MCSPPSFKLHFTISLQPQLWGFDLDAVEGFDPVVKKLCGQKSTLFQAYSKCQGDVRLYKLSYECCMAAKANHPKKLRKKTHTKNYAQEKP